MNYSLFFLLALTATSAARAECDILLSDPQINYAPVTRGELLARPENGLMASELRTGDAQDVDIAVQCDAPTALALQFIAPVAESQSYRFGAAGRATLVLHDLFIDDRQAEVVSDGRHAAAMAFTPEHALTFWQNGGPATGTFLRGKVRVTTWMPGEATRVSEQARWMLNGSFVLRPAS